MADFKSIVAKMFRQKQDGDKVLSKARGKNYKPYTNEEIAKIQALSYLPTQLQKEAYKSDTKLKKRVQELTPKAFEARPAFTGFMEGLNPISGINTLQGAVGKIDVSKTTKSAPYVIGNMVGQAAQYAMTGGLAQAGVANAAIKGTKLLGKGLKAVDTAVPTLTQKIAANAAADVVTGVPLNIAESLKTAKNPEEFAKNFAINTALDVGIGGAIGAAPAIIKALKAKTYTKPIGETLEKGGYVKDAQVAEVKVQQAVKNLTQRKLKPSTTITQPLPESQMVNTQVPERQIYLRKDDRPDAKPPTYKGEKVLYDDYETGEAGMLGIKITSVDGKYYIVNWDWNGINGKPIQLPKSRAELISQDLSNGNLESYFDALDEHATKYNEEYSKLPTKRVPYDKGTIDAKKMYAKRSGQVLTEKELTFETPIFSNDFYNNLILGEKKAVTKPVTEVPQPTSPTTQANIPTQPLQPSTTTPPNAPIQSTQVQPKAPVTKKTTKIIKGLDGTPLEVVNGNVILYHRTTPESATAIYKKGSLDPNLAGTGNDKALTRDGKVTYLTTNPSQDFYGDSVVMAKMPLSDFKKQLQFNADIVTKMEKEIADGDVPDIYLESFKAQIENIKQNPEILSSKPLKVVPQPSTTTLPTEPIPSTQVPKASKRKAKEYPVIDEIANMQYRSKKQMNNIHSKFVKPEKETVARSLGGDIKTIQRSLFNSFAPIENRFRKLADKDLMNRGLNAVEGVRKTEAQIQHMIQKGMLDNSGINVVGDSLSSVKEQIGKIVDDDLWNIYYAHLQNVYRPKGQAVFPRVTAKESQSIVNKIELDHPEILDAREIALNWRNQMDAYDVASGNMSLAEKEAYREANPFYFPIARVQGASTKTPYSKKTAELFKVYKVKGGQKDIQPWHVAQENWIRASVSSSKMNDLGNVMEEVLGKSKKSDEAFSPETYSMGSSVVEEGDKKFLRYLKDGKQVKAEITPEEYVGLKDFFNPKTKNKWAKRLGTQSRLFKDLTVNWNPIFPLINGPRDFFDAVLNSKDAVEMLTSYPKAFVAAVNSKNPYNKLYHQAGVQRSQFVDRDLADSKNPWIKNTIGRIEEFNSFVEMLPRMAEFVATIDKSIGGKVTPDKLMDRISKDLLQTAGRNAAEVTLNFDKSGLVGKYMNETLFPFFNPALQGFAKTINLFTSPAVEKTYKDYARLLPKLALWGILPAAFNEIVYKDNEAYQKLNSRDKNLNYIFMLPNGYAVKIPKGRIQAALSIPARETIDPDKTTPLEVAKSIYGSVGVPNPTSSNIIFPAWGAFVSGKNWMGYDIESQKDSGNAIQERWDSSTSEIGKFLGKFTGDVGLSPKDIDYLIDSYTGFLGDVILPLTTKGYRQGKGNTEDILGRRFLINPTYQNELASKFYNYMDEAEKIGNDNEATDKDKMYFKFLSRYNDELTDLRKQIEEVQLSNAPNKKEQLDALQEQLNATYDTAINGYENFELFLQDSGADIAFEEAVAKNAGGTYKDYAEFFNESKMDYQEAEKAGIPVEVYYKAFSEMSTDGNDNISQAEAKAYLDSTNLNDKQKAIMWNQVNSGWKTNPYTGGTISTSKGGSKTSAVAKAYRSGLATKQVEALKNINIDAPNVTKAELKAIIKMLSA